MISDYSLSDKYLFLGLKLLNDGTPVCQFCGNEGKAGPDGVVHMVHESHCRLVEFIKMEVVGGTSLDAKSIERNKETRD